MDRFHETLAEMRRDREQDKKWDQHGEEQERHRQKRPKSGTSISRIRSVTGQKRPKKWDKHIEDQERHRAEEAKKWDKHIEDQERHRAEEAQKWKLWQERWDQHDRRHQEEFNRVHEEIMALAKKHDRSIGALGARWGMQSERSFRNALAGILEEHFGVKVTNVNEYDEKGVVFWTTRSDRTGRDH